MVVTPSVQSDNQVSIVGLCRIVACILHNYQLTTVYFDHQPLVCICHDAWQREGLPVPPYDVVRQGWKAVLECLRKVRETCENYPLALYSIDAQHKIICISPHSFRRFKKSRLFCCTPQPFVTSTAAAALMCIICCRPHTLNSGNRRTQSHSPYCTAFAVEKSNACRC